MAPIGCRCRSYPFLGVLRHDLRVISSLPHYHTWLQSWMVQSQASVNRVLINRNRSLAVRLLWKCHDSMAVDAHWSSDMRNFDVDRPSLQNDIDFDAFEEKKKATYSQLFPTLFPPTSIHQAYPNPCPGWLYCIYSACVCVHSFWFWYLRLRAIVCAARGLCLFQRLYEPI